MEKHGSKIRFSNEDEIALLVGLFGESSFCGIRKKRPRIDEGIRYLDNGDSISYISGAGDESFVELRYDGEGNMSIGLAYK